MNEQFGMTPEMQKLIEAFRQAQQNQQQQEPPTAAQYVDDQFRQANEAKNDAYRQAQRQAAAAMSAAPTPETQQAIQAIQQQPQQQQLMTPERWRLMNQMADLKGTWEGADALAKAANPNVTDGAQLEAAANSLRNASHNAADNIRQIANAANIDLSGIEDVGYADAQRNLQTRQTKEVADILSARGKYGMNSDQYYDAMYMQFIGEGKSAREAKRLAGQFAQRYQYDRVSYLRNAYNMYGRDGNYTNEDGVSILQELAMEMPEVANVYAQAYKMPTTAQDRAETLEDKILEQTDAIARIAAALEGNSRLQREQHEYSTERDAKQSEYRMREDENRYGLMFDNESEMAKVNANLELRNLKALEEFKQKFKSKEPNEATKLFDNFYALARMNGANEDEATAFASQQAFIAYVGGKSGAGKGGTPKDDSPKWNDKQQTFMNQTANLFDMAKQNISDLARIQEYEAKVTGADAIVAPDGKDLPITMMDFPVGVRQEFEDRINALYGGYYKSRADDNKASEYWRKVRDVALLEGMFPNENFDEYWKRRGGKPQ